MERYFDTKQAAEFLGVSPYTIIAWKKRGILGFTRLGRAIRYPESELVRFGREGFHEAKNRWPSAQEVPPLRERVLIAGGQPQNQDKQRGAG